jgi:hypothetical protein
MDRIDTEISNNIQEDVFSPESLAWRLLVDDEFTKNNDVKKMLAHIDLEEENNPEVFNKYVYEFEILLTIYLEMVFGWYKLLHLMQNENNENNENNEDLEKEFELDLTKISLNDLIDPFKEKFKMIGYNLSINEIKNKDFYDYLRNESYCRVALRDLPSDFGFFEINKNRLDPKKRYHFIINSKYKGKDNLRDIFMLLVLNDIGYKINFNYI